MPAAIIDLRTTEDVRDVIHQLVQALAEGKLVAFPTETVYGIAASALNAEAVENLIKVKKRSNDSPLTLAVKSADDALDFVPDMGILSSRLARRCWPGPLTLVLDDRHPDSVVHRLPKSVQDRVVKDGAVGLRVPAHDLILSTMRLLAGPLTLTSANPSGQPDGINAQQVAETLGEDIAIIVDDGESRFAQPSSVVRVTNDDQLTIMREGVLDARAIHQLSNMLILVVCTGNTCRSPMAEVMLKDQLAKHYGVEISQLDAKGVVVMSAGTHASSGSPASPESVDAMNRQGLDLAAHASQPVTARLVRHADVILTMTHGHRMAIVQQWPEASTRTFTLSRDSQEVSDPFGGPQTLYDQCAEQIARCVNEWLPLLPLPKSSS